MSREAVDSGNGWGAAPTAGATTVRSNRGRSYQPLLQPSQSSAVASLEEPARSPDPRDAAAWRVAIDWLVTIVGAILIVLAIKAWVVNPYRIPSSSMEPTLHCARPGQGCAARSPTAFSPAASSTASGTRNAATSSSSTRRRRRVLCGAGGTFVKRLIGLPGERSSSATAFIYINGKRLDEPYIQPDRREHDSTPGTRGRFRRASTSSWATTAATRATHASGAPVPRKNLIGKVFATYWPPKRISLQ